MLRSGSLNSLTPRGARWVSAASTGFNRFVVFAWHAWAIMLLSGCSAYPSVGHPASNTASTSRPAVVGVFIDTLRKASIGSSLNSGLSGSIDQEVVGQFDCSGV